jgi:hypothetical protein
MLAMDSVVDLTISLANVKSLNDSLEEIGWWLFAVTALVVIGLIFDCWEDFIEVKHAIVGCFKYRSWNRLRYLDKKIKLAFVGGLLVTLGVAGELYFEYRLHSVEGKLQSENGKVIAFLNRKAEDAGKDAADANERSKVLEASNKQLGIDLESEKQKTARFEKEASDAQLALDKQVRIQGPRWRLLEEGTPRLSQGLERFNGQKAEIVICGTPNTTVDNETARVGDAIEQILNNPNGGSRWVINRRWDGACVRSPSLLVLVSLVAEGKIRDAAKAINDGLEEILPGSMSKVPITANPAGLPPNRSNLTAVGSAYVVAASNPDSVVILVGAHP